MDSALISRLSHDVGLPKTSVAATIALFDEGATIPFIARYRKEATNGLDEMKIRAIQERLTSYRELQEQRATAIKFMADQGKLTEDVRQRIDSCFVRTELEDLLLPFKTRPKTRASEAIGKGLEPLAEYLWNQEPDAWTVEEHVDVFIAPERGIATREEALRGASEIVAEWISANSEFRKAMREMMWKEGQIVSKVVPAKSEQKTKYNMYYDRREPAATVPSHRVLATRRGTKEGILTSGIEFDDAKAIDALLAATIRDRDSVFAPVLETAARYSYARLIRPAIEADIHRQIKERADREAIRVFQENLANLLLSPPGGPMVVIGCAPGKGNECKLVVVDESGKFLEESVISSAPAEGEVEGGRATLRGLIEKHGVRAVAVGNSTGSRKSEGVIRQALTEEKIENVLVVGVNDAGVSVYSASRGAREEFPDLDAAARAAVSLARRLQDPLAELVKIDPKLIGVGQYQHDVDQKELHRGLTRTVQSCVNRVGGDPNKASFALLRYIAGMNEGLARKIIAHRTSAGPFSFRTSLLSVPGMDEKHFQQAAGFLRIRDGENPLDRSAIHPESYPIVEKMAATSGISTAELIENKQVISSLKLEEFVTDAAGLPTLTDIREELFRPGRDPRRSFTVPRFRADVKDIADLKDGMTLEGTVTNVTNFGAFVDIGVHQDGLVHLSQMSNRFIRDPRVAVRVGDVVQVKVISVEVETRRIGLSMKALMPPVPRRRKKPQRPAIAARAQAASAGEISAAPVGTPPIEGSTVTAQDSRPSGPRPSSRSRRRRDRRRPDRSQDRHPRSDVPREPQAVEPKPPEPTLQEKIAILQSKFKGIS